MSLTQPATALLLAATLLGSQTSLAFAKGGTLPPLPSIPAVPPGITVEVTDKMTEIDAEWPIIREERSTYVDAVTQAVVTNIRIIRESPPFAQPVPCPKPAVAALTTACVEVNIRSSEEFSPASPIVLHVKHFVKKVCDDVNCVWRKPHQLHVQWLRTDARWFAANAHVEWGCHGCAVCGGSSWQEVWVSEPWFPTWIDDTTSSLYVFTDTLTPGLLPYDGTAGRASANSEAYHNWDYQGQLVAEAGFSP